MTNPDEVPSADFLQEDSWLSPDKKREEALNKVCEIFLRITVALSLTLILSMMS